MEEFILKFADLFDDLDTSTISDTTVFRNLEDWDSIAALSIIAMIDEEYGVTFNAADMKSCQTIGELKNKIDSKLNGK